MILSNMLIIVIPIAIAFGIPFWLMIFLNTYRHFPKMNPGERIWLCIVNATILTVIIIGFVFFGFMVYFAISH